MLNGKLTLNTQTVNMVYHYPTTFKQKMGFYFSNSGFLSFSIAEVLKGGVFFI